MFKTTTVFGLIIKRQNMGETDRLVTILTQELGRITCLAKGARQLKSSKRASLEPGNLVRVFLIKRKAGAPLLTEAKLEDGIGQLANTLAQYRKLSEFLEIIDNLFVEQEIETEIFDKLLETRSIIINNQPKGAKIKQNFREIIIALGFEDPKQTKYTSIAEYVSALAEKKLKSFGYLKV